MQNTCPNATCGAMYNLTPQHIGRTFACKKCGSTLVVTANGLEIAGGVQPHVDFGGATAAAVEPVVQAAEVEPAPMRSRSHFGPGAGAAFGQFWERIKGDLPTWLLGIGIVFVMICQFWPLLDRDKVARRKAAHDAAERKHKQAQKDYDRRIEEAKEEEAKGKLRDAKKDAEKKWMDVDEPKLTEEFNDAEDSATSWRYWYDWGTMWGFLFLFFAALGYMTPQQPLNRRIIASIILSAVILLIFIRFVGKVNLSASAGFG